MMGSSALAGTEVTNRRLEQGQTILGALEAANVSAASALRLIDALDDVFDVRQARSGHQLRIVRVDGFVEHLDYRVGPLDEYQVRRDGWRYIGEKRVVAFERKVARFEFDVEKSLWQAAISTGTDPVIVMALADAFGWELDLMRNARLGDRAKVLVETLEHRGRIVRYGDVLAASYTPVKGAKMEIYRYLLPSGERAYFFSDGTSAQRTFLKTPVGWAPVTSPFGNRIHPIFGEPRFHDGIDYGMPVGTPVRAVASGLVTFAGYTPGGGNMVCLMHEDDYESCYLHLSRFAQGIQTDALVYRKQVIAWSGNTGNTTRPHLHFNLKKRGGYVDPSRQKFPRTDPLPNELLADFSAVVSDYSGQLRDVGVPVMASP
ncbi:MAG: M23 family metallopeptidase [Myxococcaceae bacterium]|nr:M23 family metallopeptidase [Myxococcaceae bacterium]